VEKTDETRHRMGVPTSEGAWHCKWVCKNGFVFSFAKSTPTLVAAKSTPTLVAAGMCLKIMSKKEMLVWCDPPALIHYSRKAAPAAEVIDLGTRFGHSREGCISQQRFHPEPFWLKPSFVLHNREAAAPTAQRPGLERQAHCESALLLEIIHVRHRPAVRPALRVFGRTSTIQATRGTSEDGCHLPRAGRASLV